MITAFIDAVSAKSPGSVVVRVVRRRGAWMSSSPTARTYVIPAKTLQSLVATHLGEAE